MLGTRRPKVEAIGIKTPRNRAALIWQLCRRQIWWIAFAMVLAVGTIPVITALSANALRTLVDDGVVKPTQPLAPLAIRLMLLAVVSATSGFVLNQVIQRVFYHLEFELRVWLYERLQALDPRVLDKVATGQMVTRAMTDLELMQGFILLIPYLIGYSAVLIGLAIYLITQSVLLTVVAICAIPANLYLLVRMRKRLYGLSWVSLNRRARVTTIFDENVRGIRVVKAFGREDEERRRLAEEAGATYGVAISRTRLLAKFDVLLKALPVLLNATMLFIAGRLILGSALTVGGLLVFVRYSREFNSFARGLDDFANIWQYAKAAAGRIVELITVVNAPPGAHDESLVGRPLPEPSSGLVMEGVGMSFGDTAALHDFDVTVGHGSLVVVTGGPRTGKSTIAALAAGTLEPSAGSVRLDGEEVTGLDSSSLRGAVRVVSEDSFLFGRTVRENLEMGAGGVPVPDDTLNAALHAAGADEVVAELDGGFDGLLGDRGLTLSGGQRQRLGLARALVVPPRLLVLDDALMAVNPALEMDILRRIRRHAPDTAVLCLTRRDGPAVLADSVVQLPPAPAPPPAASLEEAEKTTTVDIPSDVGLAQIVSTLPDDRERPRVSEDVAVASDDPPGVVNVLKPFGWRLAGVSAVLLFFTVLSLVPDGLFKVAVDAMNEVKDGKRTSQAAFGVVVRVVLGVVAAGWAAAGINYFLRIGRRRIEEGVLYLLRRRSFQRVTRLGVDYYDRELPGYVAARVVYDLDRIGEFMEDGPFQIISSVTLLAMTFVVIVVWSVPIAIVGAAFIPLLVLLSFGYLPLADRAYTWTRRELGDVVARLQEDFAGRHVIHAYRAGERAHETFWNRARERRRAQRWSTSLGNAYFGVIFMVLDIATAAVLWRSGSLVLAGAMTTGALFAIQLYIEKALAPIPRVTNAYRQYLVARASFRTLQQPFRAPINPPETDGARECPPLAGEILFRDVTFAYPGTARDVLHRVSVDIPPGEVVAVVGPTGAGKSSIAKLISRIYDPNEGAVLIDGLDLRELEFQSFRRRIGVVPQDAFCFRGTVASNVSYGRPDSSRADLERAARAVGAFDALAALHGGFDAPVEEEGRNLTAAQRQLMALARAWLTNPDILVLDEATATLDQGMEEHVLDAVRALGTTTVLITHRLQVAQKAHKVLVVDGGRIVEQGTHDELIGAGGAYAKLWSLGPEVDFKQGAVELAADEPAPGQQAVPLAPDTTDTGGSD